MNWFFGMVKFWKGYENKQSLDNPGSKVSGVDKVMEAVRKKLTKKVPDDTLVGLEDYLMSRFYKTTVEEGVFYTCFRLPANGEKSVMLRAADIFRHLSCCFP